jgi:hypothetical protein
VESNSILHLPCARLSSISAIFSPDHTCLSKSYELEAGQASAVVDMRNFLGHHRPKINSTPFTFLTLVSSCHPSLTTINTIRHTKRRKPMVKTFVTPNTFQKCFCESLTMMTSCRKEMKMLRFVPKNVKTGRITYRSSCTLLFVIPNPYRNETEQTKHDGGYDLSRYMKKQAPCPCNCSTDYANALRIQALTGEILLALIGSLSSEWMESSWCTRGAECSRTSLTNRSRFLFGHGTLSKVDIVLHRFEP